ncbi:T9SS type B sorting domain-containing protein [Mangrovimonas xylaniphaga]|uniref:T9SS type B sorting domain-containing protein n=1 Tax=Mangrovimonas xylaniphaga TaxID=1645915 RepID=UPI0006B431DE|nr:T9SS type B sorting domain-containing protein [Mangrovimonas xylaniphaga]
MNNTPKHLLLTLILLLFFRNTFSQEPTDCFDSVTICGNSNLNLNVNGVGIQELFSSNSCSGQENNSIWLKVTVTTNGTLGFTLTPNSTNISEDYDFFVFGPNVSCDNLGQAIRCSTTNPSNANLSSNTTGMNATESDTSEGPGPDGNSFVKQLNVNTGDTYYIVIDRPIGVSPFSLEWTGTAEFYEPPTNQVVSNINLNMETCDDLLPFDDGLATFDLEANSTAIIGKQTNTTVSYYENESDANIGEAFSLGGIYTNKRNPQTIYFRITNTITNCYTLGEFNLKVNPSPDFNPPSDLESCDNIEDGDATNGQTIFDLGIITNEIIQGFEEQNLKVSYHETLDDAESENKNLSAEYFNSVPDSQEIFIRIEDPFNPDCKIITSCYLIVNPIPVANDTSLIQCDENSKTDGLTLFNLTEAEEIITGGSPNRTIQYFLSESDISSDNTILNPEEFNNSLNPQNIFVKITDTNTGCTNTAILTIEVSTTSTNSTILKVCDNDGTEDGFYNFILSDASEAILNGLPSNLDLKFYETYQDALLKTDPLPDNFTNSIPYSQTIFARVEINNGCYGISEVLLEVLELPNLETEYETFYCLNLHPETLTLTSGVIDGLPLNYNYTWSTGETTESIIVDSPGTYTVRVSNTLGCFKKRIITVLPSNTATIESIEVIDASENNLITVFVTGDGDYEFALEDIDGPYQDSPTFTNIEAGLHTAYVRDKNGCGITEKTVSVIGFPKFFTPNGDGYNDFWQVKGISPQFQANSTIYIFDRYGQLVKELTPLSSGWDGTFNGKPLPSNDYWFSVTLEDGRTFTSHFTLKL